jgi:hypothetical protein
LPTWDSAVVIPAEHLLLFYCLGNRTTFLKLSVSLYRRYLLCITLYVCRLLVRRVWVIEMTWEIRIRDCTAQAKGMDFKGSERESLLMQKENANLE